MERAWSVAFIKQVFPRFLSPESPFNRSVVLIFWDVSSTLGVCVEKEDWLKFFLK